MSQFADSIIQFGHYNYIAMNQLLTKYKFDVIYATNLYNIKINCSVNIFENIEMPED